MFLYRVYVGCNVPNGKPNAPDRVENIGLFHCPFDGCTVQHVKGVWKGETESTVVFEYVGPASDLVFDEVLAWAKAVKEELRQESVLATRAWLSSYRFV